MSQPDTKKRRLSPAPLTDSQTLNGAQTQSQDALPDEDNAAPPSTASGAHAKPLSALFGGPPALKGSTAFGKGKGKGKAQDGDDKEGFESILSRLQEGGE